MKNKSKEQILTFPTEKKKKKKEPSKVTVNNYFIELKPYIAQ